MGKAYLTDIPMCIEIDVHPTVIIELISTNRWIGSWCEQTHSSLARCNMVSQVIRDLKQLKEPRGNFST
jgi:hypothetical protein